MGLTFSTNKQGANQVRLQKSGQPGQKMKKGLTRTENRKGPTRVENEKGAKLGI